MSYRDRVKFGHIIVPETRNSDGDRMLKIAFCIIKGFGEEGLKNPIVYLPGGPGGGMTSYAANMLSFPGNQERFEFADLILFDPRGCGKSEPDLCPQMDLPEFEFRILLGKTFKEAQDENILVIRDCYDSLRKENVNLNAYGSDEVAEDLEDLRVTLGINQWNFNCLSYGTRFGQAVIRKFPNTVRSAVFAGLVPTVHKYDNEVLRTFSLSLKKTFASCESDQSCSRKFQRLEDRLFESLEYYDHNPLIIPSNEHNILRDEAIFITGKIIAQGLFRLSYDRSGIEIIPQVIQSIANRDEWVLKNLVVSLGSMFVGMDNDMYYFIRCNDSPYFGIDPDNAWEDSFTKKLERYVFDRSLKSETEFCRVCQIDVDSLQYSPVPTDIPAILFTGEFDPITPPENTLITAGYFSNSTTLTLPGFGHYAGSKCLSEKVTQFFKDPFMPINLDSCLLTAEPVNFVTDVVYNKGISRIGKNIQMGNIYKVFVSLAISVLMILFGFISWPVYSIVHSAKKHKRKKNNAAGMGSFLIWILTLLSIIFLILLFFSVTQTASRNIYILAFGLPKAWNQIFWMALPMIVIITYFTWRFKEFKLENGNKFIKVTTIISFAGVILLLILMWTWGLLWPLSN